MAKLTQTYYNAVATHIENYATETANDSNLTALTNWENIFISWVAKLHGKGYKPAKTAQVLVRAMEIYNNIPIR